MAISRNLIELMDGWITLHSEGLEKGTTVKVALPVVEILAQEPTELEVIPEALDTDSEIAQKQDSVISSLSDSTVSDVKAVETVSVNGVEAKISASVDELNIGSTTVGESEDISSGSVSGKTLEQPQRKVDDEAPINRNLEEALSLSGDGVRSGEPQIDERPNSVPNAV